jgi:hypothetical protein
MNRRRCEGTPFRYANLTSNLGVSRGTPLVTKRRAILASSHGQAVRNGRAFGWKERGSEDHFAHPRRSKLGDDSWQRHTSDRMTNDDDVLQPGALDVADERVDKVGDGHLPQVTGFVPPSRHVEGEHG